jgi:hypothetical protein
MRWLGLAAAAMVVAFGGYARAGDTGKPSRPRLGLRATPRVAMSPVYVLLVAELTGGDEIEDFYCPGLEWDWGDGSRSAYEGDCAPFEPGMKVERFFSARHAYLIAGEYSVRLTLRRASRVVAVATAPLVVRGMTADMAGY